MRAALTALLILAPLTLVDAAQDKVRPDQVYVRHPRTGAVSITNAVVQTNGLKDVVVVDARGGEDKIPSGRVVRIIWGAAPPTLTDADKYFDRGDWPNAAKGYLATFGDASARDVVKAAARVRAAESLLRWGATDPHQFVQAAEQARGFLNDHATNRDVPEAQMLEARALLLSGKPTDAAAGYRLVFDQYAADQTAAGYDPMTCMRAGLLAGRAALVSADTLAAREMFTALDTAVGPLVAGLDPDDVKRLELQAIVDEAILGEGFAELAAGNSKPALTFFKNKASSVDAKTTDTLRSLAALGLGEALLAEGKAREAQMQFARVSALDHTDRDRVARAHLRLAECELKLLDQDFKQRARQWLEAIGEHYGDTPSAAAARDLLATLGS
jgi:hypothetical protein